MKLSATNIDYQNRPAIKAGLFFFFFLFFIFPIDSEEAVVFPFGNRLVRYMPGGEKIHYENKTQFFFLNSYCADSEGLWISAGMNRTLGLVRFDYATGKYSAVMQKNLTSAIVVSPNFFTLGPVFIPGKGFAWNLYTLDASLRLLAEDFIDLFISHQVVFEKEIFLAGTNQADTIDGIYLINPANLKRQWVFKEDRKAGGAGFLKFISYGETLLVYYSAAPEQRKRNRLFLWDKIKRGFRELEIKMPSRFSFYGPGFIFQDRIFIPCIDVKKNIYFGDFSLEKNLVHKIWIKAPTGIYSIIRQSSSQVIFLGYNYFRSQADFYLVVFQPDRKDKDVFLQFKLER